MEFDDSYMEYILANPGLHLIAENITSYLDLKDLDRCQAVSRNFKFIVDIQKKKFVRKIGMFREKLYFKNKSTWDQFFQSFNETKPAKDLKAVADFLKSYSKENSHDRSPFFEAILRGNNDFLKLIMNSSVDVSEIIQELSKFHIHKMSQKVMPFDESDRIPEWGIIRLGGNYDEEYCKKQSRFPIIKFHRSFMRLFYRIQGAAKKREMPVMAKVFHNSVMSEINLCAIPGLENFIFVGPFN